MTADHGARRLELIAALQAFVGSGASDDSWDRLVEAMVAERDARVVDSALWDERDRQVGRWQRDLKVRASRRDAAPAKRQTFRRFSRSEGRS